MPILDAIVANDPGMASNGDFMAGVDFATMTATLGRTPAMSIVGVGPQQVAIHDLVLTNGLACGHRRRPRGYARRQTIAGTGKGLHLHRSDLLAI